MPNTHLFVHIGDAHLAPGPRNADRRRAIDQIIAECVGLPGLAAWLWPGDLFHGPRTTDVQDRNWLDTRLQQMAAVAPVVICYGNHDPAGDLDGFARLNGTHPIYVIDRPHVLRLRTATGVMASIFVLPYPTTAGLASGDVVDVGSDALEAIFRPAGEQLAAARATGDITLTIGHVNKAGSASSSGQPQIGREIEIDDSHLALLGDGYVGLNHIHKPQQFYAGSICRMDFGEIEAKRYLLVTYGPRPALHGDFQGWGHTADSMPLDVAPMFHVEGELTPDGFDWRVIGHGGQPEASPDSWDGCDVRVRYRFPVSLRSVVNEDMARAPFSGARRLQLEPVAVPDRDVRAPQVAAQRTLAGKVTAYLETDGRVASAGLLAKLVTLEQRDEDAIRMDAQALVSHVAAIPAATVVDAREEVLF